MAEIAVSFLLNKFDSFVKEKLRLIHGVRGELVDVRNMLEHLRAADSIEDRHRLAPQIKVWVEQVREVAYDLEDVIDEFMLRLHGHKFYASLNNLRARHRIASDIQGIKIRVKGISGMYNRYKDEKVLEQGGPSLHGAANMRHLKAVEDLTQDKYGLVGIDEPKNQLISLLVEGSSGRDVIPVFVMGGLGKTTLVRQVYEDVRVKKHFTAFVRVTVSHSFDAEDLHSLFREAVRQIYDVSRKPVPEDVNQMTTNDLIQTIKDLLLENRYLVVLDDVWETDDWDIIKLALPTNSYGSRVTTRNGKVASSSSKDPQGRVFTLDPLAEKDYWDLFCRNTFQGKPCPAQLEDICRSILKRCGGLPLAVVAISGVLAAKDVGDLDEWVHVSENLGFEIQDKGKLKKVLSLSFNDLPYYLKSCVLYLSIFPEDHLIEHMRLVRLWIAEGFVIVNEGSVKSPEEVAEDYLKELLNRSVVQKAEASSDGRVKTYHIHDLFREMNMLKSREQTFAAVAKDVKWPEKARRLSVISNLEDGQQNKLFPKLRSFLAFDEVNPITDFTCFRLLNVLDLQDTPLEVFPAEVVRLYHLKYLSLRGTNIKEIPRAIKKLENLETLDLKQTLVTVLPVEVQRLKKLRHLLVCRYEIEAYGRFNSKLGFTGLAEIGCMESLQKLCFIEASEGCVLVMKEIEKLVQLRRLGITKFRREHGEALCSSIEKLSKLRAMSVTSVYENETIDLNHLSSPPPLLRRIYLRAYGRATALDSLSHKSDQVISDVEPIERRSTCIYPIPAQPGSS